MNKRFSILGTAFVSMALVLLIAIAACNGTSPGGNPQSSQFTSAATAQLEAKDSGLTITWKASRPAADSYDVYLAPGKVTSADKIKTAKGGKKYLNRKPGASINVNNLTNDDWYSVVIVAKKSGYADIDSKVVQKQPSGENNPGEEEGEVPNPPDNPDLDHFTSAPNLTVTALDGSFQYTWTASNPAADSYDVYWKQGSFTDVASMNSATKITNAQSGGTVTGLANDTGYTVVVIANKSEYNPITTIKQVTPVSVSLSLTAPSLSLSSNDGSLRYSWSASNPAADSYDVYWKQGSFTNAEDVKSGTKITGATSGGTITGLTNGTDYSVVVTANKAAYPSADSAVRTRKPAVPVARPANFKRGIGYGTDETLRNHEQNMQMLGPSTSWVYTWGLTATGAFKTACTNNDVAFIPMTWSRNWNENDLRNYLRDNPDVEFLLAYNEPMFPNEANVTPSQAGQDWPRLKQVAQDFNLKIIGPALNYGQMKPFGGPKEWFEEFLRQPGVSLDDMHAIALHCYMGSVGAVKGFIADRTPTSEDYGFGAYEKPIWLTEFCAWGDGETWFPKTGEAGRAVQERYMSEMVIYLEQEPLVERYAWFMANGGNGGSTNWPFFNLVNASGLSRLGTIWANMSFCDKSVWEPAGATIAAAQFTANHLSLFTTTGALYANSNNWPGGSYGNYPGLENRPELVNQDRNAGTSVHFRPTTDTGANAQPLDVYNFNGNNKWMEYQVDLSSAKNYTLSLRFQTVQAATIQIYVDDMNTVKATAALDSTNWNTQTVDLGNISAGHHTIRLKANGGNCTLNWLKVE